MMMDLKKHNYPSLLTMQGHDKSCPCMALVSPMRWGIILLIIFMFGTGCTATTAQIIPTERPTITPTFTTEPTDTPEFMVTMTNTPRPTPLGGATPTPLFGPTRTPAPDAPTPTRSANPNAPRIEFFTSDSVAVAPGEEVTLFWSIRGADTAVIYQLSRTGERERLWNVDTAGNLTITTRNRDRGQVQFTLSASNSTLTSEQTLSIPLACPVQWFFGPPPEECPDENAQESLIIEQQFQSGRMVYIGNTNTVYVLFNDGDTPKWLQFENLYDPNIHPESQENFVPPPNLYQPIGILGFVWRGNDTVRNRLQLATNVQISFDGFFQTALTFNNTPSLYISSTDATVLQLLGNGSDWQIITAP